MQRRVKTTPGTFVFFWNLCFFRSQSRYCSAGTDKVASRAVSALEGRDLTAFVVSFASAMRQLKGKSGVSPLFTVHVRFLGSSP